MSLNDAQLAINIENLSNLYLVQSLLAQINFNLALINQGASGANIIVNGANLFQLAAQYYGDASLWTNIALANDLVDPVVPAGVAISLTIPQQTTDTMGIYQA